MGDASERDKRRADGAEERERGGVRDLLSRDHVRVASSLRCSASSTEQRAARRRWPRQAVSAVGVGTCLCLAPSKGAAGDRVQRGECRTNALLESRPARARHAVPARVVAERTASSARGPHAPPPRRHRRCAPQG